MKSTSLCIVGTRNQTGPGIHESHLELATDAVDEEFPAVLPGVHKAQATHLIPYTTNDVLHLIVREQIWDLTCVQVKQIYRRSEDDGRKKSLAEIPTALSW